MSVHLLFFDNGGHDSNQFLSHAHVILYLRYVLTFAYATGVAMPAVCAWRAAERLRLRPIWHIGRAQNGSTALIWAAEKGHSDCARLLLDAGADKNAKCNVRASAGVGVCGVLALMLMI